MGPVIDEIESAGEWAHEGWFEDKEMDPIDAVRIECPDESSKMVVIRMISEHIARQDKESQQTFPDNLYGKSSSGGWYRMAKRMTEFDTFKEKNPVFEKVMDELAQKAASVGLLVYATGGFVRDLLLGKASKDLDVVVDVVDRDRYNKAIETFGIRPEESNPAMVFSHMFEKSQLRGEAFGVYAIRAEADENRTVGDIEVASPRGETYENGSRKPKVQMGDGISLRDDAIRRDFGMNTLYLNLATGDVADPTGHGLQDIRDKMIRISDPESIDIIFRDDPLRILRAIRFSGGITYNKCEDCGEEF